MYRYDSTVINICLSSNYEQHHTSEFEYPKPKRSANLTLQQFILRNIIVLVELEMALGLGKRAYFA